MAESFEGPASAESPANPQRRAVITHAAAAGLIATTLARVNSPAQAAAAAPAPIAGKPGDFDFLAGNWKIRHRKAKTPALDVWDEFEGEATCWTILGGVASIEELRIPARNFSGMGLRLLDVDKRVWSDYWVNGKSGVLGEAGLTGAFENGVGTFTADDVDADNKPIKVRGVWDRITSTSCRWRQGASRDGGKTWQENWFMDWTRV